MQSKIIISALFLINLSLTAQTVAVSATTTNYLYAGIDNPVDIVVENCDCSKLYVEVINGTITGTGCHYIIKPSTGNNIEKAEILVYRVNGKKKEILDTVMYTIRHVMTIVTWGNQRSGGKVNPSAGNNPLIPMMEDFDLPVYQIITSFTISFSEEDEGVYVKGNVIPDDLATKLKGLKSGSKVYFNNIKVTIGDDKRTTGAVFIIQ